jgi:hypothetical protein
MGIKHHHRGPNGSSRGDDTHGVTNVNRFSATTRKAAPISSEEQTATRARGEHPDVNKGSQAAYGVTNGAFQGPGEGMKQVRSKYKESRKDGFSPDGAREQALSGGGSSGTGHGPNIKFTKDAYGKSV